jgi:Rps23 Pro-64 3,4-dihydroxylase Tpa1-like proline 4-hydroxylase
MPKYKQSELKAIADDCADLIRNSVKTDNLYAKPFKHIILDNFLPQEISELILSKFPKSDDVCWERTNDDGIEVKSRTNWHSEFDIPDGLVDFIRVFNSAPILTAMSEALEIPKLMSDPYYSGGGLNLSEKNGLLDVHVDGNYHDASGMNRRVNLLYYLNPNWQTQWGGEFGLYDHNGQNLVKSVEPIFNRCVIFDTHDRSYHGLPNPINFPQHDPRRSILLYYYTVAPRPADQTSVTKPHSALWRSKGYMDKKGKKTRGYK